MIYLPLVDTAIADANSSQLNMEQYCSDKMTANWVYVATEFQFFILVIHCIYELILFQMPFNTIQSIFGT